MKNKTAEEDEEFVKLKAVGLLRVIRGGVAVVRESGTVTEGLTGLRLRERDRVVTKPDGAAVVEFKGGNRLHVQGGSDVEVKQFQNDSEDTKKLVLNLSKGKIRNQVHERYNGQTSYYQVVTKSAVAGVRGTDFVMDLTNGATRVETLQGLVALSDAKNSKTVVVAKGRGAVWEGGELRPVYEISPERLRKIDEETDLDRNTVAKATASSDDPICRAPAGRLNQCAWTCVNNPPYQKKCRVDLPNVVCQRSRCNANGDWTEATSLLPVHSDLCPPKGFKVLPCDY